MLMVVVLLVVVVVVVVVVADFAPWKESYPKIMSSYFFTALAGDEF